MAAIRTHQITIIEDEETLVPSRTPKRCVCCGALENNTDFFLPYSDTCWSCMIDNTMHCWVCVHKASESNPFESKKHLCKCVCVRCEMYFCYSHCTSIAPREAFTVYHFCERCLPDAVESFINYSITVSNLARSAGLNLPSIEPSGKEVSLPDNDSDISPSPSSESDEDSSSSYWGSPESLDRIQNDFDDSISWCHKNDSSDEDSISEPSSDSDSSYGYSSPSPSPSPVHKKKCREVDNTPSPEAFPPRKRFRYHQLC